MTRSASPEVISSENVFLEREKGKTTLNRSEQVKAVVKSVNERNIFTARDNKDTQRVNDINEETRLFLGKAFKLLSTFMSPCVHEQTKVVVAAIAVWLYCQTR